MKKTPLVFEYDFENEVITNKVKVGCEWVFSEDSVPTHKIDGTACLFKDGKLWKRYDRKLQFKYLGKFKAGDKPDLSCFKTPPDGFVPCEEIYDPNTFHWPGWVPIDLNSKVDQYYVEGLNNTTDLIEGQTYELIGPKIGPNAYNLTEHKLVPHGKEVLDLKDVSFEGIKKYLTEHYIEGIVFHNKKDGRVAKITRRYFELFWQFEDERNKKKKKS